VTAAAPFELALRMTALLLVLRPQGPLLVQVAQVGLAAAALLDARWLWNPAMWLAAAAAVVVRIGSDWPLADNHIYLLAYWCLAIGLALGAAAAPTTLQASSRWLIGSAFALAVIWKALLSPDFLDGRFFRMTLIVDTRFEALVRLAGGMSFDEIDRHRLALVPLGAGAELSIDDRLVEPVAFRRLALALTWAGLVIETAVAAAFLVPLRPDRRWLRHGLLVGFCVGTYPIAPVAGFGWLLLAMGVTAAEGARWRNAFVAAWLIVLAGTALPWVSWLADALGRP
jgi:hypothetical protein